MKGDPTKQKVQNKNKGRPFFNFQGNKFSKLARDYHHELLHLTIDLRRVNQRIQESTLLCRQQIDFIRKSQSRHLISKTGFIYFEDALYHLENFTFRIASFRDKLVQFINQALRIGFEEKSTGVLGTIVSHGTVRDAHIDTEIKKFDQDKDFSEALSERTLMTHRRYYKVEAGYNMLLIPGSEAKDRVEKLKLWKQNIKVKANRANRIVLKIMDIDDRVMQKINDYLIKHPVT